MTKFPVSLQVANLSAFTRSLAKQLGSTSPSHLTLMNMIARAAGYTNVQHLRSSAAASRRLARAGDEASPIDHRRVERTLQQFDREGKLVRWPSKRSVQDIALWVLWSRLPRARFMTEREVSDALRVEHLFGDPATLRRTMLWLGLLTRRPDGADYRRVEQRLPPEALAAIQDLKERRT